MATYEYRCDGHGTFDVTRALGTAPETVGCPRCQGASRRVYSAPMLTSVHPQITAALDHEEKTRHEPDVVTSLPPATHRRPSPLLPLTPTLRRLPRP
jgi:putative FmdB family regulatory protein